MQLVLDVLLPVWTADQTTARQQNTCMTSMNSHCNVCLAFALALKAFFFPLKYLIVSNIKFAWSSPEPIIQGIVWHL